MNRWNDTVRQMVMCGLVVAVTALPASAGSRSAAVAIEDKVPVRAGAGTIFYFVGELEKGQRVEVDDKNYGWYKIVPPKGVYSYVKKQNVDLDDSGRAGIVNADRVPVSAAKVSGPGGSYRRQLYLFKGDPVVLADRRPEGAYYKIVPPKGCYVWVQASAMRRVDS